MDGAILEIVLKARDEASATIEGVGKKAGGTAEMLSHSFKDAAIVSGVALAGLAGAAFTSIEAFQESDAVMAQTNAVLKSTKGAAGETADEIGYLAQRYMGLTGISDETIQSAENMLLTFTQIHKDVFPQATKTVLDMSVALGQDTKNSAIQLGKALNDPINGMTALRRVGVTFNDEQKNTIKRLQESGDLMGAQKVILKELQTEFGGSAEAAGKTFGGQLNVLKESVNNLQEAFGGMLVQGLAPILPKLNAFIAIMTDWVQYGTDVETVAKALKLQLGGFGDVLGKIIVFFGHNRTALVALAGAFTGVLAIAIIAAVSAMLSFIAVSAPVLLIFAGVGAAVALVVANWKTFSPVANEVGAAFNVIAAAISNFVGRAIKDIMKFINDNKVTFQAFWIDIVAIFRFALGFIQGFWNTTWQALARYLADVWQIIKGIIEIAWGLITIVLDIGMGIVTGNWSKAWEGIKKGLSIVWDGIKDVISGGVKYLIDSIKLALDVVIGLVNGVISGFNKVAGAASNGKIKIPEIPHFQDGGFVPATGLAVLHAGEFVLSKAMLTGQQSIPTQVMNSKTTNNTPINIYATVDNTIDMNLLGNKIAFALRNSR